MANILGVVDENAETQVNPPLPFENERSIMFIAHTAQRRRCEE